MNKPNLSALAKSFQAGAKKHAPEILTGVGITGMLTTTIMAVKATPKALKLMEREKKRAGKEHLDRKEVVAVTWKCYIPSLTTGTVSIACLIGASSVNARRNTALAAAYTLTEETLKEYRGKVVETIGEKKEKAVRDEIAKDKLEKVPVTSREVIVTERGNTLCFDAASGRYFRSDIEAIRQAENELNRQLIVEMYMSLNEFYYLIGLPTIRIGDDIGWNMDDGLICFDFSTQLATDGSPCLVVDYSIAPRYDFRTLM